MLSKALAALILLGGMVTETRADIRYRIRPRFGELDSFGREPQGACTRDIQNKLWSALMRYPVLIVDSRTETLSINFFYDGTVAAADRNKTAATNQRTTESRVTGTWLSTNPNITFGASVEERRFKTPLVKLSITVRMPKDSTHAVERACTETWTGMGEKF
jgi:hypothetical protein